MKKIVLSLVILLFIFGGLAIGAEGVKVPFNAVKSSCYNQIDMSKAEFSLLEIGKKCVKDSWLEENLSQNNEKVESEKPKKTEEQSSNSQTSELEALKQNTRQILNEVMGETVNWGDNQKTLKEIDLIEQVGYSNKVYLAKISYRINDNFTKGMIKGGMFGDAMDFIEKLFNSSKASAVVECMLMPEFKMVDQYGNESEEQVAKIVVSRELAKNINWENMYRSRFRKLVRNEGQLWLHPAMRD